jgi:molybdenum cofactor biosynthesis enzyme MoaA
MNQSRQTFYHITVLSNFARGFDKYSHSYSKARIPESTYPDRFFVLRRDELGIGVQKAAQLLEKIGLAGNRLIVLETELDAALLQTNTANGRGQFIYSNRITLSRLYEIEHDENVAIQLCPVAVEDAMAASLRLLNREFLPFVDIRPRAISFLPVALACQAKCPFCFSKASVSSDQAVAKPDWEKVSVWLDRALAHGAERAVITGGGEPTLLPAAMLQQLVAACASRFDKVVLITNGHTLAMASEADQVLRLGSLYDAGLRVLAISRHHFDAEQNERLMHLHTPVEALIRTWRENQHRWPQLRLRLISVLQEGGVEDDTTVENYLSWASNQGVEEICFKELYVSTSAESVYHDRSVNDWSRHHQVSLSLVTDFAERQGFVVESRLPWGAPVYRGKWQGNPVRIAAYTEPSLFWERTQGIARSWNVMADGRCHVSLEDRASEIKLEEVA